MGFLAVVSEFLRSVTGGAPTPEVKCDLGGDEAVTGYHFGPPGIDAPPLPKDLVYLGEDEGRGNAQALAYQDPKNPGLAAGGEFRVYARASDGTIKGSVWLKGDGSILIATGSAVGELGADGAISLGNGSGNLAIDAAGNVTATTPLGTFGSGTHMHASPFGPTAGPIPGT